MFMSGFLLFRALGLAAANLTVNEWMNRQRYVQLHYTGAGFSNRFDRGVSANCYDFWCGPKFVDYWQNWEAGDQVRNTIRRGWAVGLMFIALCASCPYALRPCLCLLIMASFDTGWTPISAGLLPHIITTVYLNFGAAALCCAGAACVLQEMQRKGTTVLVPWSPSTLIRYWDLRWAQYQQRLMSSRARRKELQMHRRMLALGLPGQAS
jgi:hypothetical protein